MIASSAFTAEAMSAPAVAVSPSAPRPHAQEDSIVEIAGAIITHGCALVRCVAVISIFTNWLNADVDHDLRLD
jgi:cytochrome c oxidase assembly factor CtaG